MLRTSAQSCAWPKLCVLHRRHTCACKPALLSKALAMQLLMKAFDEGLLAEVPLLALHLNPDGQGMAVQVLMLEPITAVGPSTTQPMCTTPPPLDITVAQY